MRIANLNGRLALVQNDTSIDVETASGGVFGSDPQAIYTQWDAFAAWAASADFSTAKPFTASDLHAVVPQPRQIFCIGLNYRDHAAESNLPEPEFPLVFTKFQSSIASPTATITLPADTVDWEVELVVVIGREARGVAASEAWNHVAGLTAGQDISERTIQTRGPAAQFSMGKSFAGFAPIGPVVVSADEFENPESIRLQSALEGPGIDGTLNVQDGNTSNLIFPIPAIIEYLSSIVTLYPGDIIFTGTPAGVGMGRTPKMYLTPGQTLTTTIEGIGQLRNELV